MAPLVTGWLYFGCHQRPGHYLFSPGMRSAPRDLARKLERLDAKLAPQDTTEPYIAVVSRLGGYGCSALSFWDYSVDRRQGSNSIVFAPSLTISPEDLLAGVEQHFPEVRARLPSLTLRAPEGEP
jgi:hypothetical protein